MRNIILFFLIYLFIIFLNLFLAAPVYCISQKDIDKAIVYASFKYHIPVSFLVAVIRTESDFNINAVSSKGAIGLMQIMPETAKMMHIDPDNPLMNILGGAEYLHYCLKKFNSRPIDALACYNAGPHSINVVYANGDKKYKLPPYNSTLTYILKVYKYWTIYNKLLK
jgi:soluble lytic murein transglycosylase-like protein